MTLREPVSCTVGVATGAMIGGTGRYEKSMSDLDGLYADERPFGLDRGNRRPSRL